MTLRRQQLMRRSEASGSARKRFNAACKLTINWKRHARHFVSLPKPFDSGHPGVRSWREVRFSASTISGFCGCPSFAIQWYEVAPTGGR